MNIKAEEACAYMDLLADNYDSDCMSSSSEEMEHEDTNKSAEQLLPTIPLPVPMNISSCIPEKVSCTPIVFSTCTINHDMDFSNVNIFRTHIRFQPILHTEYKRFDVLQRSVLRHGNVSQSAHMKFISALLLAPVGMQKLAHTKQNRPLVRDVSRMDTSHNDVRFHMRSTSSRLSSC